MTVLEVTPLERADTDGERTDSHNHEHITQTKAH